MERVGLQGVGEGPEAHRTPPGRVSFWWTIRFCPPGAPTLPPGARAELFLKRGVAQNVVQPHSRSVHVVQLKHRRDGVVKHVVVAPRFPQVVGEADAQKRLDRLKIDAVPGPQPVHFP